MPSLNDYEGDRVVDASHLLDFNLLESGRPSSAYEARLPTSLRLFLYAAKGFPYR